MKILLYLLMSYSFPCSALIQPENMNPKMSYFSESKKYELSETAKNKIEMWAAKNNLQIYSTTGLLPFEMLLTDSKLEKTILVTANRRTNVEFANQIYNHKSGFLLQLKAHNQQFALFLLRHNEKEALNAFNFLSEQSDTEKKKSRQPASELARSGANTSKSSAGTTTTQQSAKEFAYAFADSSKSCVIGLFQGVNGLADPFVQAGRSTLSLAQDPAAWWDRSVNSATDVMENLANFKEFAKSKVDGFIAKTPNEKSNIYCSFVGGGAALGAASKISKLGSIGQVSASAEKGMMSLGTETVSSWVTMKEIISGLESKIPAEVSAAVRKAAEFKLTPEAAGKLQSVLGISGINGQMALIAERLEKIITSSNNLVLQTDAMNALVAYGKSTSGGWVKGYVGRLMSEMLPSLSGNYLLPDSVRKIAYEASKDIYKTHNWTGMDAFVSSAELRSKDMVSFLGKSHQELLPAQSSNAAFVERNFINFPNEAKSKIYSSLNSGKGIPEQYQAQYVESASIPNANYVMSVLRNTGFTYSPNYKLNEGTSVFTNAKTGSKVFLADDVMPGQSLRNYTPDEIAQLKEAMTQAKKIVTITSNKRK